MATETKEATSQPAAQATNSDGKKAANVSASQLEALFKQQDEKRSAPPAADTKATGTSPEKSEQAPVKGTNESTSTAEPANAGSPEAETAKETPAAETEADGAEDGEGDQVLSPETSSTLDAATKAKIQRRIDKEVAKRKAQEARTQQLEGEVNQLKEHFAQLAQAQAPAPPPLPAQAKAPLPDIKDATALTEYRTLAKQTVRSMEAVLDREDIDWGQGEVAIPELGDKPVTKAQVKTILRNARIALEDTIPAQQEFFQQQARQAQQRTAIQTTALQKFPFLKEKDNNDVNQTLTFFQQNAPELLGSPAAAWVIGAYIKGIKALVAEESAAAAKSNGMDKPNGAKPAATKPKAPGDQAAVSTTGTTQRLNPDAMNQSAAATERLKFLQAGNATGDSAAKFLERMELMRMQRR